MVALLALPDAFLKALPVNEFAFRDRVVLALNPASVSALTVERGDRAVTVVAPGSKQTATRWRMTAPVAAPADEAAVTGLLTLLQNLDAASWESPTLNDSAFGLSPPWLRVKWEVGGAALTRNEGAGRSRSGALRIGSRQASTPNWYANIEGEPTVFALAPQVVAALQAELRDRSVLRVPAGTARRVDLVWPHRTLAVEPAGPAGSAAWRGVPGYDPGGFDFSLVGPFLSALADLKTPRFLQYDGPIPGTSGLNPPRFVARVTVEEKGNPKVLQLNVGNRLGDTPQRAATTAAEASGAVFILPTQGSWDRIFEEPPRPGELPDDVFAPGP